MRPSLKLALIGGEVTLLAAFTGLGIHLVMQPHREAFRPPPIVLPTLGPPTASLPLVPPPSPPAAPTRAPLVPDVLDRFGRQDHNLVVQQWEVLQQLTGAIERYLEARVLEQLHQKR